jgi:hypothetical protein
MVVVKLIDDGIKELESVFLVVCDPSMIEL